MDRTARDRLYIVIENSRHLRGTGSVTDLAFDRIEEADRELRASHDREDELHEIIWQMKQAWYYKLGRLIRRLCWNVRHPIIAWRYRAISSTLDD